MKKLFILLILVAFALVSFAPATELPIGADMPKADLKMKDVSGIEISLKEAVRQNGLLVMFSCNTCPFVKKNQQRTRTLSEQALKNEVGVFW